MKKQVLLFKEYIKTTPFAPIIRGVLNIIGIGTSVDSYDTDTKEVLKRILKNNSCCIDIGANQGFILEMIIQIAS